MSENKINRNRLGVISNTYQREYLKVLAVCAGGCLRSPTAAHILASNPFNFNTRCCGISKEFAIVPLEPGLIFWADEIVVMDENMGSEVNKIQHELVELYGHNYGFTYKKIHILDIEDDYDYRDPELVRIMTDKFLEIFKERLKT